MGAARESYLIEKTGVRWLVAVAVGLLVAAAAANGWAEGMADSKAETDSYPLDAVSREVPARGPLHCPEVEMVRYRGEVIRYHKPVRIYVAFRDRLHKLEEVVRDTAIEVYGRAPRVIRHLGTYNCRRIRSYPTWISEHGLGNAIDIEGFDFGPARGAERKGISRALRGSFSVRVEKHWGKSRGIAATHARFLDLLARRLVARPDIFRILLGPAFPGHHNHFHFDVSTFRLVEIWPAEPTN